MPTYTVHVVDPPGYAHAAVFDDITASLCGALVDLGHAAQIVRDPSAIAGQAIVLGANLLAMRPDVLASLPSDAIIYNLEQIDPGSPWCGRELIDLLSRSRVADYSPLNIDRLEELGVHGAALLEVGHHPSLERIDPLRGNEDIDVLFYGSLNDRRSRVLEQLQHAGAAVHHAFGVYGAERDALIARSRIVLNVHHFNARVFEIVRVSYLLANGCFVVSETGDDQHLESPFADGVAFAPYEDLAETCLAFLANPSARTSVAERGRAAFRARPQTTFTETALAQIDRVTV